MADEYESPADLVAKAVEELLQQATYSMAVSDQLLFGRGVTRLRLEVDENDELAYGRVVLEHIQADDYTVNSDGG